MKIKTDLIQIQQLPSGDSLNIKVYKLSGNGAKKIYIQANIHGPEMIGILVAKRLVKYFKDRTANFKEVIIIPSCNPMGLNQQFIGQQTGYVNHLTGVNWNRIYKNLGNSIDLKKEISIKDFSDLLLRNLKKMKATETDIESRLALTLQELSFDSDIVIDLHTAWGIAPQYIYCYPEHIENAKKFDIPNIITLSEDTYIGVFDEAQLYPYIAHKKHIKDFKLPKQVFTVELGSDCTLEEENIEKGLQKIISYLSSEKIFKKAKQKPVKTNFDICKSEDFIYYHALKGGLLVWKKKESDYVQKGDILCEIHDVLKDTITNIIVKKPGKLIIKFNAHAVHEGQRIAKVMTHISNK